MDNTKFISCLKKEDMRLLVKKMAFNLAVTLYWCIYLYNVSTAKELVVSLEFLSISQVGRAVSQPTCHYLVSIDVNFFADFFRQLNRSTLEKNGPIYSLCTHWDCVLQIQVFRISSMSPICHGVKYAISSQWRQIYCWFLPTTKLSYLKLKWHSPVLLYTPKI